MNRNKFATPVERMLEYFLRENPEHFIKLGEGYHLSARRDDDGDWKVTVNQNQENHFWSITTEDLLVWLWSRQPRAS